MINNKKPCGCKEVDPCKCKEVDPCGCVELDVCGCKEKHDWLCDFYSGDELSPLGITAGMDGNLVIKIINDFIRDSVLGANNQTIVRSIGSKVDVYKGFDNGGHEIKSIEGKEGVTVNNEGDFLSVVADGAWIKNFINNTWFITLLQNIFNTPAFQTWFANYITNLIVSEQIDICTLIAKCAVTPPEDLPPVMSGDITYYPANRSVNFPISVSDFTSKYSDPEGDAFVAIKITGGNLTGLVKSDLSPLAINDVIPLANVSGIKYNSPNSDSVVTQTVTYVAINSKGQQSN